MNGSRLLLVVILLGPAVCAADTATVDADAVVTYVKSCRKPNGAFGPRDQEYTDAAWNVPAVGTLRALDADIDQPEAILAHGLGRPAGHVGLGHQQFFHHHLLRDMLHAPITPRHPEVTLRYTGGKRHYYAHPYATGDGHLFNTNAAANPDPADVDAAEFRYHDVVSLAHVLVGLQASGRRVADPRPLVDHLRRCLSESGGFRGDAESGAGVPHVAVTAWAVIAFTVLDAPIPHPERIAAFIAGCHDEATGAYRWNPRPELPGNDMDVYYTWAALAALHLLETDPPAPERTVAWLNSLHNADGGFGDRPGWRSRLASTFYAVDALRFLGHSRSDLPDRPARGLITTKRLPLPQPPPSVAADLRIYQAQFKVPTVPPGELAGLGRRGFNLLGIKSDEPADVDLLRPVIERHHLPMDVVLCPEMYPHRLVHIGGATLTHVGTFTLDVRWNAADRKRWRLADAVGRSGAPWETYRDEVLAPIRRLGGFAWPEQDYDMEHAYVAYDTAPDGAGGYNAVLCGFNWPPQDFVRVFPWRERYTDRLTTIADVDAHGDLTQWSGQMDTVRTLFVARGPRYADFQEAAAAGRVVTVIARPPGVASGASYYGPAAAVEFVKRRRSEWQWWK